MILGIDVAYMIKTIGRIAEVIPYTIITIVVSGSIGLLLAMGISVIRIKRWKGLAQLTDIYVSFFRSTPCIIHLFLIYYGLPILAKKVGINMDSISKLVYAITALILFNGACMSEFIRPAYLSIDKKQHDAADSIGMTELTKFRRILLPQILPVLWPNLTNAMVELVKDTSVLFVIGLVDIMGKAKIIISNDYGVKKLEIYIAAGVIYWLLTFSTSKIFHFFESKVDYGSRNKEAGEVG